MNVGKIKSPNLPHSFKQTHTLFRVLYLMQGNLEGLMERASLLTDLTCTVYTGGTLSFKRQMHLVCAVTSYKARNILSCGYPGGVGKGR